MQSPHQSKQHGNSPAEILTRLPLLPDDALVRVRVVSQHEACSPATIWRRVRMGLFPAPIKQLGVTAWRVGDLRAHHARLREPE